MILSFLFIGLFAGKDIRFGNQVSHSEMRTRRSWKPNVQKKRVFSDALNDWVSFQFTTTALKAVDHHGGIDNYLLSLDDETIQGSNYVMKYRELIASVLFHQGALDEKTTRKMGYHRCPPPLTFPKKLSAEDLEC